MASSLSGLDPVATATDGVSSSGRFVDAIGTVAGALGQALTLDDGSWVGKADVFFVDGIIGLPSFRTCHIGLHILAIELALGLLVEAAYAHVEASPLQVGTFGGADRVALLRSGRLLILSSLRWRCRLPPHSTLFGIPLGLILTLLFTQVTTYRELRFQKHFFRVAKLKVEIGKVESFLDVLLGVLNDFGVLLKEEATV